MFTTISTMTLFLAKAMGGYMIAAGLSGLTMKQRWVRIVSEIRDSAALPYMSGIFIFAIGCVVIWFHNFWTDPLAIIVSLFGWGAMIEGLLFIVLPGPFLKFSASFMKPGAVPVIAAGSIIGGVLMISAGFFGRVG